MRSTLTNLVTRLRRLIGDPASENQVWDDNELTEYLDAHRLDYVDHLLTGIPTYGPESLIQFRTWVAPWGDWEEDAALKDSHYNAITADAPNYLNGRWVFTVEPHYPLYLTGKTFDLFGAAADVLEAWGALKLDAYDFQTADNQKFSRSQMFTNRQKLADSYRRKQRPQIATQVRSDVHPDDELTNLKVLRR